MKPHKQPQTTRQHGALLQSPWKRWLRKIGNACKTLLAIVGAICTLYTLLSLVPELVISPSQPRQPWHIIMSYFPLTNKSLLPVYNVEFSVALFSMHTRTGAVICTYGEGEPPLFEPIMNKVKKLGAKETKSFSFSNDLFGKNEIQDADLGFIITYEPFLIPLRIQKRLRYNIFANQNGEYVWAERSWYDEIPESQKH